MQRAGADPTNMEVSDFICDYSGRVWDGAFPMVEGHKGALISGDCLTVAYTAVVLGGGGGDVSAGGYECRMCLETRDEEGWVSPATGAAICTRCIKQGAGRLHKDEDWEWRKPE